MTTQTVLTEVAKEREYQDVKWGKDFDDTNSFEAWNAYITHYASRNLVGKLPEVVQDKFRTDMIKVAALAVAAVEAIDRN